jgi:subtilisin family serine protease
MRGRAAGLIAIAACFAAVLASPASSLTPTDPQAGHAAYSALNLPAAWDVTTGSPDVVVAVVDSGVDATHPDLQGAVEAGHNFVDDDADASDILGHGTAVAGVVAARANGLGSVGVCFECGLMPLRVVRLDGFALNTDTAAAIDYAVDHGAAVVNASLYGERSPRRLHDAVARARAQGVLVVAAAGNEGNTTRQYPAAFPEAISVASATAQGPLATFSSRGSWVDFAAPECAPMTLLGGGTGVGCATSISTPLVAGTIALLRSHAPFATAADLEFALASTARPVTGTQHGLVDAAAALARLGRPAPTLVPVVLDRPVVGDELEAFTGVWSGAGLAVSYHWERCRSTCSSIPGATASRYTPTKNDAGFKLRVAMSADRAGQAFSATTQEVAARPVSLTRPSIAGRPSIGARLVARHGSWDGTNLRYSIEWLRCRHKCVPVAEGASYRVQPRDRGARLRIAVDAANSVGAASALSRLTSVVR